MATSPSVAFSQYSVRSTHGRFADEDGRLPVLIVDDGDYFEETRRTIYHATSTKPDPVEAAKIRGMGKIEWVDIMPIIIPHGKT